VDVPVVHLELDRLPFPRGALRGVRASHAYRRLRLTDLPRALAEVHRVVRVGGRLDLTVSAGASPDQLVTVVEAAGFALDAVELADESPAGRRPMAVRATAQHALPDYVGAAMGLLCVGLNPSLHAADAGVGYVTASNRFWKAMAAAGLATRDRDPRHLLDHDGIGMTDLVKRPTARADALRAAEYRAGVDRLDALCRWLEPAAVAIVGLAGWRAGVDRHATVGWQPRRLGPSPVYVMPSTSGLNAGTSLAELVEHLQRAAAGPAR